MNLEYDEIKNGDQFEELVAEYFRLVKKNEDQNISNVKVEQSGIGTDGGVDILVEFEFSDDITVFKRRWVVQCKFHKENISPSKIQTINIPTLLHSHRASGYLLICRESPTSGLTQFFNRLNKECKEGHRYMCWTGSQFKNKLLLMEGLHQAYFPKYFNFIKSL